MGRKASEAYLAKLRDPRWQKKRLEILERDGWTCQKCYDSESTLHVHHRWYTKGADPWECPDYQLVTLCEGCHEDETRTMPEELESLAYALKRNFFSGEVNAIMCGFHALTPQHTPDVVASAIEWVLTDDKAQGRLIELYFEHTGARRPAGEKPS